MKGTNTTFTKSDINSSFNSFFRAQKLIPFILSLPFWMLGKIGSFFVRILLLPFKVLLFLFKEGVFFAIKAVWDKTGIELPRPNFWIFKKHRGRPRTTPLHLFLYRKIARVLNIIFPSPLRVASMAAIIIVGFFFYSLVLVVIAHDLPSPKNLSQSQSPATTEFFDRNGKLLYRLYDGKNRTPIKLSDVPDNLIKATVAMEDKNFYAHNGVDLYGVARAMGAFIQHREVQGGSTITQQLIKNTLLTPERTLERKLKEVVLAFWAERIYSKQDILQMYFNEVPYGGPAWGIAAAAQTYFNKSPKELSLAEAAYLAGLPASPTTYSPYGSNPELGKDRQKEVLRRMTEEGYITKLQADQAYTEQLNIQAPISSIKAPHFVMYVRSVLASKYGEKMVSQGGLKVITTLDLDTQDMAEKVVSEEVSKLANLSVSNGAAMITDAKTGQILAMVGSKDYWSGDDGNFNVATARRQPGSSIKPITYATGFKQGYSPGSVLVDAPVVYRSDWDIYAPVNYDGRFHGPVTVRTAIGSSYNIPAVKMLNSVGIPAMLQTAKDLGITTFDRPDRYGLSLTLGGGEVKLIDMMTAYGTFSQNGVKHVSEALLKVTDPSGEVLEDNTNPVGTQVLDPGIAYMMSNILADNGARTPAFGPNSLLNIPGKTVAVKTGTTDNKRDNWTFGYTPELIVGVWVGNNNNAPMNQALTSGVTGAAPIWNRIMTNLVSKRANVAFAKPDNVGMGVVDGHRDLVLINSLTGAQMAQKQSPAPNSTQSPMGISFTDPLSPAVQNQPLQAQPAP